MNDLCKEVDAWIRSTGIRYFDPLTNMALLAEEVGELARIRARAGILVMSQFTLHSCTAKGDRPSYISTCARNSGLANCSDDPFMRESSFRS